MTLLDLGSLPVGGALEQVVTDLGLTFRRAPRWADPQIVDSFHRLAVRMPAGVRLELATDSPWLELDLNVTRLQVGERLVTPVFDVVVEGRVTRSVPCLDGEIVVLSFDGSVTALGGSTTTVRIDDLPGPGVPFEIWFPHSAAIEVLAVRVRQGSTVRRQARPRRRWIHHGSSISHCLEAKTPTCAWPMRVAIDEDLDLLNLAMAGNAQLDQHVARTIRDQPADLISLKLGINVVSSGSMRERTFVPMLHGFLDTIRDGHPVTPVHLVTPILCPCLESRPGPSWYRADGHIDVYPIPETLLPGALSLIRVRELMQEVLEARRATGDAHLHLVDGLRLFGHDDLDELPDGVHPSPAGYERIATRFREQVLAPVG